MATKALNYTAAEINQRLNLAGTAVQPSALNDYYTKTEINGKVVVDLSTRYNTSYANLSAALTALNSDTATDAVDIKKGGVSIKFINSTTNKYEQWNLKASSWSTDTSDWISITDPTAEDISYGVNGDVKEELDKMGLLLDDTLSSDTSIKYKYDFNAGDNLLILMSDIDVVGEDDYAIVVKDDNSRNVAVYNSSENSTVLYAKLEYDTTYITISITVASTTYVSANIHMLFGTSLSAYKSGCYKLCDNEYINSFIKELYVEHIFTSQGYLQIGKNYANNYGWLQVYDGSTLVGQFKMQNSNSYQLIENVANNGIVGYVLFAEIDHTKIRVNTRGNITSAISTLQNSPAIHTMLRYVGKSDFSEDFPPYSVSQGYLNRNGGIAGTTGTDAGNRVTTEINCSQGDVFNYSGGYNQWGVVFGYDADGNSYELLSKGTYSNQEVVISNPLIVKVRAWGNTSYGSVIFYKYNFKSQTLKRLSNLELGDQKLYNETIDYRNKIVANSNIIGDYFVSCGNATKIKTDCYLSSMSFSVADSTAANIYIVTGKVFNDKFEKHKLYTINASDITISEGIATANLGKYSIAAYKDDMVFIASSDTSTMRLQGASVGGIRHLYIDRRQYLREISKYPIRTSTALAYLNVAYKSANLPSEYSSPTIINIGDAPNYDSKTFAPVLQSITDNTYYHRYVIYVHSGTYDIISEMGGNTYLNDVAAYVAEAELHPYPDTNVYADTYVGLNIPSYVDIIGVDGADKCIIKGFVADENVLENANRYISTINTMCSDYINVSGLKFTAYNLRYAHHGDCQNSWKWHQEFSDCIFEHLGNNFPDESWWSHPCAVGLGASRGCYYKAKNCVFNGVESDWSVHDWTQFTWGATYELIGCKCIGVENIRFGTTGAGDYTHSIGRVIGCHYSHLIVNHETQDADNYRWDIEGYGNNEIPTIEH